MALVHNNNGLTTRYIKSYFWGLCFDGQNQAIYRTARSAGVSDWERLAHEPRIWLLCVGGSGLEWNWKARG